MCLNHKLGGSETVKFYSALFHMSDVNLLWVLEVREPVFALSGIASQNATQIDPSCDSKCHMRRTHVRYKRKHRLFDKNTQCHGGWQWIKNAVICWSILVFYYLLLTYYCWRDIFSVFNSSHFEHTSYVVSLPWQRHWCCDVNDGL